MSIKSFRELVDLWPTAFQMAADIGGNPEMVRKWRQRDAIPPEWWVWILRTTIAKEHEIDAAALTRLAARSKVTRGMANRA